MNPWLRHKEVIQAAASDYIDSRVDDVVASADESPEQLPDIPQEDQDTLIQVVIDEILGVEQSIVDAAGEGDESGADIDTVSTAQVVTAFFLLSVVQRGLNRVHGAHIARQNDPNNPTAPPAEIPSRQEAIDDAVARAKTEIESIATNEVGKSYGEIVKEHLESLGDTSYVWNTTFQNSRASHISNHLKQFDWDTPPSTGHPGDDFNCQCFVSRANEQQAQNSRDTNMKNFKSMVDGDVLKLNVMGVIVQDAYWDDEVGANQIIQSINSYSGSQIDISIFSVGGDAFAGAAIKSVLQNHPANVTANVFGLAASAATTIAAGADKITIGETDTFLIHNSSTFEWGTKKDLRRRADDLETVDKSIAFSWQKRSSMSAQDVVDLMDEDRYMTAQEALELGLIDEIRESNSESNCAGGFCATTEMIKTMPKEIAAKYQVTDISNRIGQKKGKAFRKESQSKSIVNNQKDSQGEQEKMNLEEAKAQLSILNTQNAELKETISSLEGESADEQAREALREEVRNELKAERDELDAVVKQIKDAGLESKGDTANEIRRNALVENKVEGAQDLSEESVTAVFNFLIESKKKQSAKNEAEEFADVNSGADKPTKEVKTSFKVREKK